MSLVERVKGLLESIEARSMPIPESGCLVWMGAINRNGYGQIQYGEHRPVVHRIVYEAVNGPVPDGLVIDHLCRVRSCCNPAHLEAVTPQENTRRGLGPTSDNAKKTHCLAGHAFAADNLVLNNLKRGWRECRACKNARSRTYYKSSTLTRSTQPEGQ